MVQPDELVILRQRYYSGLGDEMKGIVAHIDSLSLPEMPQASDGIFRKA